jgi:DNA-binding XRE family transcriptional regulator
LSIAFSRLKSHLGRAHLAPKNPLFAIAWRGPSFSPFLANGLQISHANRQNSVQDGTNKFFRVGGHAMTTKREDAKLQEVAKRLRALRKATGNTSARMAQLCNITAQRWHAWEKGLYLPDVIVMIQLCERFRLTLDWIYTGDTTLLPGKLEKEINAILAREKQNHDALR